MPPQRPDDPSRLRAQDGLARTIIAVSAAPEISAAIGGYLRQAGYGTCLLDPVSDPRRLHEMNARVLAFDETAQDLFEQARHRGIDVPALMLWPSADARQVMRQLGAQDYLCKPFSPREFLARVDVLVVQRSRDPAAASGGAGRGAAQPRRVVCGDLVLNRDTEIASCGGRDIDLSRREFELLAYLASRPGVAVSRLQLMTDVWKYADGDATTVTVHVRRLRVKLGAVAGDHRYLQTVQGIGYRFQPRPTSL